MALVWVFVCFSWRIPNWEAGVVGDSGGRGVEGGNDGSLILAKLNRLTLNKTLSKHNSKGNASFLSSITVISGNMHNGAG